MRLVILSVSSIRSTDQMASPRQGYHVLGARVNGIHAYKLMEAPEQSMFDWTFLSVDSAPNVTVQVETKPVSGLPIFHTQETVWGPPRRFRLLPSDPALDFPLLSDFRTPGASRRT